MKDPGVLDGRHLMNAPTWRAPHQNRAERLKRKCATSCPAYGNYQPPYHECTCGAEEDK